MADWSDQMRFNNLREMVYESMQRFVPIALIYSYICIIQSLFLTERSFFSETLSLNLYKNSWLSTFADRLLSINGLVLDLLMGLFSAFLLKKLVSRESEQSFLSSLFLFIFIWFCLGQSNVLFNNHLLAQPFWFLSILVTILFSFLSNWARRWERKTPLLVWLPIIGLVYLSTSFNDLANLFPNLDLNYAWQSLFFDLIGNGPTQFITVLVWSLLAVFFQLFGFPNPASLTGADFYLPVVTDNLNAVLSHSSGKVEHLMTLYTLQSSFALFGGVGILLALALAILIVFRKKSAGQSKTYLILSALPLVFDQPLPFLMSFPILFQPLLLLPMAISTALAEASGAICLSLGFLKPAIYDVPAGTPNLLFGFLASNGDWRYLLVVGVILVVSAGIYYPFVRKILEREACHENVA
ncbi:PTS sugar transporter subunit IIC [Streptococcus caballi]|uniref:PTS sugar transporter subunit IIC n=1 Tax=Streptococcus caballi TaxID=439220 RepID=UPI001F0A0207|nr:PTS sugar transporter subunit IIC [Streptococcus caballi]